MVAATTYELESQGGGSLEERLSRVKPIPFQGGGGALSAYGQMKWNGGKTTLWLRIFNDKNPEKPLVDEAVLLDYSDSFSARWAKPPSPLITLPPVVPDLPEDLVREQRTIQAKGAIRDIIAAGDGSTVLVQTNQPPYWAALDLKTGDWMSVPWKATADTLAATQAGRIYLIDKLSKIVEVWDMASGKREGLQLLPLEGSVTAVAAPLSDAAQPVMVATEKNAYFLDPVKFEVISSGLDVGGYFNASEDGRRSQTLLDPATVCLRAADDGSLYQFSGDSADETRKSKYMQTFTVDRSAAIVLKSNDKQLLASRGRNLSRDFPDHGGGSSYVTPVKSGGRFPGPQGEIRIVNGSERNDSVVMKNPPAVPNRVDVLGSHLLFDRGLYFDSSLDVMLLPDEDKLHLVRLNLTEVETQLPGFVFGGETLEIPLPAGSGHKIVSENEGVSEIGPKSIRWTAPEPESSRQYNLKLEWTGELGSQISKDHRLMVLQSSRIPEVLSPDGRKSIPLRRRNILTEVDSDIKGFAGSGTVMLVRESGALSAWNLATGEMLVRIKMDFSKALGDADRIYLLDHKGRLSAYDIQTGEPLGQTDLGEKIRSITTAMSSRNALLAVEQDGVEGFLIEIPRDSLKPRIIDLPQESRRRLFMPALAANVSGSAVWSRGVGIFRDSRAMTVKPFEREAAGGLMDGVPDATGRFVVDRNSILDIGSASPKEVKFSSLPGFGDSTTCKMDESGRYIMLSKAEDDNKWHTVSLRDVREPSKELLKIRLPSLWSRQMPWLVSGTNTLVQFTNTGGNTQAVVYDFDISELIKQLSR